MKLFTESLEFRLRDFHETFGQYIGQVSSCDIPYKVKKLRMDLIREEYEELMGAMANDDLIEIADACADLVYVVIGTAIAYGIPFDRVFAEVHRSNMTKTPLKAAEGEKYGTTNPKGPGYIAPDLNKILYTIEETELEKQTQKEPSARQEAEGK